MTKGAIVCQACGAKVRATRTRCPKCRAVLTGISVPQEVHVSKRAAKIAGGVLAFAFVATVVILWRAESTSEPATPPPAATAPPPAGRAAPPLAVVKSGEVPPVPPFEISSKLPPAPESRDDAAAIESYRRSLERDPADAASFYNLGRVLLRLGRVREAPAPLKEALTLQKDNWSYTFSYGYAAALAGEMREAVSAFRAASTLMPDDAVTHYDLALALQRVGDHAGAAEQFALAIRLDSGALGPRLGLAILLDRQGKTAEAITAYEDCLQLMDSGPEADRIRARIARLEA